MRELKFRAYDTEAKCYIEEPILADNFGQVYVVCEEASNKKGTCLITHKPNVVIEQYTGQKDRDGEEIYEGDILQYFGATLVVEYHDATFWGVKYDSKEAWNIRCFIGVSGARAIGNIHENPELLEEE